MLTMPLTYILYLRSWKSDLSQDTCLLFMVVDCKLDWILASKKSITIPIPYPTFKATMSCSLFHTYLVSNSWVNMTFSIWQGLNFKEYFDGKNRFVKNPLIGPVGN